MLQKEIPTSKWLTKDTKKSIFEKSVNIKIPLTKENEIIMKKMIDFVDFSQDSEKNKNNLIRPAVGIAASQIGKNINMFYIKIQDNEKNKNIIHALVNPKIVGTTNKLSALKNGEGCLSVDKQYEGYVERSYKIIVEAYDYLKRKKVKIIAKDYEAIVLQHEQDHLEGKLYYQKINKDNPWKYNEETIYL